jgi:hypothetical protein
MVLVIPPSLLTATLGRAPGFCVYGGPGLYKTHAVHTLPPPILHLDVGEGGASSILPWLRRSRLASQREWWVYNDDDRQSFIELLDDATRKLILYKPRPYIDTVSFDNTSFEDFDRFTEIVANFDVVQYNSLVLDSLHEFAELSKTNARGAGNYDKLMTEVAHSWIRAQERSAQKLRKLRNYRDSGVFIYMTGSEDIAKDYVQSPLEKRPTGSQAPEAYSIRGTVDLPGKLAGALSHIPDVLCHARLINGRPVWITEPEMLPGGGAHWDAKDRFGRLERYETPNFRVLTEKIYGKEAMRAIYGKAMADVVNPASSAGE